MSSFIKKILPVSSLASAFVAASVFTGSPSKAEPPAYPVYETSHETARLPTVVDTLEILLLDVSSSMDVKEIQAAMEGVKTYLKSAENKLKYQQGLCIGVVPIYFADKTEVPRVAVICSPQDVETFSNHILAFNEDVLPAMRHRLGPNTFTDVALDRAKNIVEIALMELKVFPETPKNIVFVGDELGNGDLTRLPLLRDEIRNLGGVVHAIAIGSGTVRDYFERNAVTPPQQNNVLSGYALPGGAAFMANTPEEISRYLQGALSYNYN